MRINNSMSPLLLNHKTPFANEVLRMRVLWARWREGTVIVLLRTFFAAGWLVSLEKTNRKEQ
jgi:hypothetical protein